MPGRTSLAFSAALLSCCAVGGFAQPNSHRLAPLALHQTRYRLRAGDIVPIAAAQETLDFVRTAKGSRVTVSGSQRKGFVFGTAAPGDELVLAASLTMKPGEYTINVSAVSEGGDERSAAINVILDPIQTVPSTATAPPVVLLNGFQLGLLTGCPPSNRSDTFGNLPQSIQQAPANVPVVYFFDNCVEDPNGPIEDLGNVLGLVLNLIKYDTGALVPQVDLVAHSMGGLIARSYLAGLQTDGTLAPPVNPRVRKFIEIATPNFGSFLALTGFGAQLAEMIPGSGFLWNLATWNQRGDDLRGVDALAIAGNLGYAPNSGFPPAHASDGVVSLTSASLGFARDPSRTRILPYCHSDFGQTEQLFVDCLGAGIVKAPETATIVASFLANTSAWQSVGATVPQDPFLSQYGGIYFSEQTATGQSITDTTAKVSFGTANLVNGGTTGTVFYNEFLKGTDTFKATGTAFAPCGPFTEPAGYYTVLLCKVSPQISSVGPLLSNSPAKVVQSGVTITIRGSGFGPAQCSSCSVSASPGPVALQVSSWSDQAIAAVLPASFSGLVKLRVQAAAGSDVVNIMAQASAPANPVIVTSVVNAFGDSPIIAANTWVAIKGTNLAPHARIWAGPDFVNNQMPAALDGVSVTLNGKSGFVYYISATQINILTPPDLAPGPVQVQVANGEAISATFPVQAQQESPSFFVFDGTHVTGTHVNGSLLGPTNLYPGSSTPAKPSETLILYANGFGVTSSPVVSGSVSQSGSLPVLPVVKIGGTAATVQFAGLVSPGLFQLNVVVPSSAPDGDNAITATYDGLTTPAGVVLTVQH